MSLGDSRLWNQKTGTRSRRSHTLLGWLGPWLFNLPYLPGLSSQWHRITHVKFLERCAAPNRLNQSQVSSLPAAGLKLHINKRPINP